MKQRGLTLMEVLIAVSIIAIVAGITFVVATKVKRQMQMTTCVSHFQKIHSALMLYRVEYGVVNYGDYKALGLPTDVYFGYGKDKVLIADYGDWICPTPLPNRGGYWPHYEYLPIYDDFADAYAKYRGKTPLVLDYNHNNWAETSLYEPNLPKRIVFVDFEGKVTNKIVTSKIWYYYNFDFFELDK